MIIQSPPLASETTAVLVTVGTEPSGKGSPGWKALGLSAPLPGLTALDVSGDTWSLLGQGSLCTGDGPGATGRAHSLGTVQAVRGHPL